MFTMVTTTFLVSINPRPSLYSLMCNISKKRKGAWGLIESERKESSRSFMGDRKDGVIEELWSLSI